MNHSQNVSTVPADPFRLPFSTVRHLLLPAIYLSIFLALNPGKNLRILVFFAYVYWSIIATGYTVGTGYDNYAMGCQFGGACLVAWYNLIVSDPLTEWRHASEPGKQMAEQPYWERVYSLVCTTANHRGIGWSFQVPYLPPLPSHDRWQFLIRRTRQILWNLFLADVAQTYQRINPLFSLTGENAMSMWSQGYVVGCLNILGRMALLYTIFNASYDLLSMVCVAIGLHEPRLWPDIFGPWSDSYTVRRFWSRTWHQSFRRFTSSTGKATARLLHCKPGTWLSSRAQLVGGFAISGFAHILGDIMVGRKYAGCSVPFFFWQVLAITFEDLVIDVGKNYGVQEAPWTHAVGWVWTFGWFCFSTPIYVQWTFEAGAARYDAFSFSIVRPMLGHASSLIGVDLIELAKSAFQFGVQA